MLSSNGIVPFNAQPSPGLVSYDAHIPHSAKLAFERQAVA
jgi:hypothetical protein